MRGAVGRCCDYRAMRRLMAVLGIAATFVAAIPAAADTGADPGAMQTLTPPPPRQSQAELDERFLSDLTDAGMQIANVKQVIDGGHRICAYIGAKHTEADAVKLALGDNTTLTEANAETLIETAVAVYCPQLSGPGSLA
jgi:Protein of unknown function (DUF732)